MTWFLKSGKSTIQMLEYFPGFWSAMCVLLAKMNIINNIEGRVSNRKRFAISRCMCRVKCCTAIYIVKCVAWIQTECLIHRNYNRVCINSVPFHSCNMQKMHRSSYSSMKPFLLQAPFSPIFLTILMRNTIPFYSCVYFGEFTKINTHTKLYARMLMLFVFGKEMRKIRCKF